MFPDDGSGDPDGNDNTHAPARVHVVDDDPAMRSALVRLLATEGYEVLAHRDAQSLVEGLSREAPLAPGCIVLDVAMPGVDGLGLQQRLAERGSRLPIVFLTGRADVPASVVAMKRGAFDFLTKPVDELVLLACVERAVRRDRLLRRVQAEREATEARLASLTAREREVLTQVMAGRLNKQIAADLGTAEKTVKVHRARGMEKMRVRSVAELVRMVDHASHREAWPSADASH